MDWTSLTGDMLLNNLTALVLLRDLETAATIVLLIPSAMLDHMWQE